MVKLGWIQDPHIRPSSTDSPPGAGSSLTTDIQTLGTSYSVEDIYVTGDLVHPADKTQVPHTTMTPFNRFWSLVDDSGYGGRVTAIPGNHDVPLQTYLESDSRATLRMEVSYPGVTVLLVNTSAPGWSSVGPGSGGVTGAPGVNSGYLSETDLKWLDNRLSAAGTDAKIVLGHHGLYFANDSAIAAYSPDGGWRPSNNYELCKNCWEIHEVLSNYNKVVAPASHYYQFGVEGSYQKDGVTYAWKKHYYNDSEDTCTTFGYIDATSSSVTVKTVDHSSGDENTIVSQTF